MRTTPKTFNFIHTNYESHAPFINFSFVALSIVFLPFHRQSFFVCTSGLFLLFSVSLVPSSYSTDTSLLALAEFVGSAAINQIQNAEWNETDFETNGCLYKNIKRQGKQRCVCADGVLAVVQLFVVLLSLIYESSSFIFAAFSSASSSCCCDHNHFHDDFMHKRTLLLLLICSSLCSSGLFHLCLH